MSLPQGQGELTHLRRPEEGGGSGHPGPTTGACEPRGVNQLDATIFM